MEPKNFFTFTTLLHKCTIFIMITIFTTLANHGRALDRQYEACVPRTCGNRLNISYLFWISQEQESFCGYPNFEITCKDEEPVLRISNEDYIIKDFFYGNNSLLVASAAVYEETCPTPLHNLSLSRTPFNLKSTKADLFFWYNCTKKPPDYYTYPIDCASNATHYSFAGFHEEILVKANYSIDSCQDSVYVPVDVDTTDVGNLLQMNYTEILKTGFFLNWTAHNCSSCEASSGRCGFNDNKFVCFCADKPHVETCDHAVLDTLKDIQSDGYSNEKAEELDITDDVGLLKHGPPTPSPDSRTSRKTTPPSSN
ncbi:hypothetical protein Q3G72_025682 [Acer saccharum]|nr:hypothetical protein Q3G72_025682 [Acer saccharum]